MAINMMMGLCKYNRLPQEASSCASIFQQLMDKVLEVIENVSCNLFNALIVGEAAEDCENKLLMVLQLDNANIKVNIEKCFFFCYRAYAFGAHY